MLGATVTPKKEGHLWRMSISHRPSWLRTFVCAAAISLAALLVVSSQAFGFSTATIYNPLSLSNTVITQGRSGHAVTYFSGWTNRFAIDIASPDQYADREIYLWGVGWSTANVGAGSPGNNAHVAWTSYSDSNCTVAQAGTEYAVGFMLNLPNGQTAGFSISHLSNYHYAEGALVNQGAQVANLSWHASGGATYAKDVNNVCFLTATAPHVHVESARTGTTTLNDVDPDRRVHREFREDASCDLQRRVVERAHCFHSSMAGAQLDRLV